MPTHPKVMRMHVSPRVTMDDEPAEETTRLSVDLSNSTATGANLYCNAAAHLR